MELLEEAKRFAKEGQYEAALGLFREAGGRDGAYGAGACLYKLGRYDEAREALHHCLELEPQYEKARDLLEKIPHSHGVGDHEGHGGGVPAKPIMFGLLGLIGVIIVVLVVFLLLLLGVFA